MRLVICEDDKDLLGLIEVLLADLNVELIKCSDDVTLREIVLNNQVDLLVVDYWLKNVKADEVILEIKKIKPELPIILMSAINNLPEVTQSLSVNDYIKKPFDIDNFISKVKFYYHDSKNSNN